MAKTPRVIEIEGIKEERVRYGRATLTIACSGGLGGNLGRSISAFERGELSGEELCHDFVQARVRRHSPSFDWETADFDRVSGLVFGVSEDPVFSGSSSPESVASGLVDAATRERELVRDHLRQLRGQMTAQPLPKEVAARHAGAASEFQRNMAKMFKPIDILGAETWKSVGAQHKDWLGTTGVAAEVAGLSAKNILGDISGIGVKGIFGDVAKLQDLRKTIDSVVPRGVEADLASAKQHWLGASGMAEAYSKQLGVGRNFLAEALKADYYVDTPGFESRAGQMFRGSKLTFGAPETPWFKELQRIGEKFSHWVEGAKGYLPVNWRELESEELGKVVEVMMADGLCLAWAPREEIVLELATAENAAERYAILVRRKAEIVGDIRQSLAEVERKELAPFVGAARKAMAAAADGHSEVALSHVAAAITAVVHGPLDYERFGPVREDFGSVDPLHEVGFQVFPFYAVGRTLVHALDHMKNAGDGFNRNLTLHSLGGHYNDANLVMALLLLTGLLREVEQVLGMAEEPQLPAPASAAAV